MKRQFAASAGGTATPEPATAPAAKSAPATKSATSPPPSPVAAPAKPDNSPINKEAKKELQKQQRLFQELEQKIATLNKQKDQLEASLADPGTYSDKNKFVAAEASYKKTSEELDRANRQYEQVFEKIMELEKTI